ncbi:heterokaryon incompatibility protein-domain-containing protein [Aspergillus alliaceus]|uniref:Heterokaryon incompatibility protein-domain-containing protein n=1 Tax=Petromyces alliaceus TaxID=209559 RepID=A0A5N7C683_PETAA|nr:heterokaryon incompatibility protein-domain-containing protein [Aspergillus alliaceus]
MPQVLNEGNIRLAELTPVDKNNPIHLNLRIIDLRHSRVPEYDALSYSSATDTFSNTIFLGPFWDVLHAPSYFQAALRCIQRPNSVRLVWGDYICIGHQTIRDKNQQVSLMREIYMSAELVPACIGRPSADSDLVLQTLKEAAWGQIVDLVKGMEAHLRRLWNHFDKQIGWMFLDQTAVWSFLQYLSHQAHDTLKYMIKEPPRSNNIAGWKFFSHTHGTLNDSAVHFRRSPKPAQTIRHFATSDRDSMRSRGGHR